MKRKLLLAGLLVLVLAAAAVAGIGPLRATALSLWAEPEPAAPAYGELDYRSCSVCTLRHRAMQRNREILSREE